VVDECEDASLAATKLAWWRNEVAKLDAGKPDHPVTRALEPLAGGGHQALQHLPAYAALAQHALDGHAANAGRAVFGACAGAQCS
jgi:phytoene/squalene synthetase